MLKPEFGSSPESLRGFSPYLSELAHLDSALLENVRTQLRESSRAIKLYIAPTAYDRRVEEMAGVSVLEGYVISREDEIMKYRTEQGIFFPQRDVDSEQYFFEVTTTPATVETSRVPALVEEYKLIFPNNGSTGAQGSINFRYEERQGSVKLIEDLDLLTEPEEETLAKMDDVCRLENSDLQKILAHLIVYNSLLFKALPD